MKAIRPYVLVLALVFLLNACAKENAFFFFPETTAKSSSQEVSSVISQFENLSAKTDVLKPLLYQWSIESTHDEKSLEISANIPEKSTSDKLDIRIHIKQAWQVGEVLLPNDVFEKNSAEFYSFISEAFSVDKDELQDFISLVRDTAQGEDSNYSSAFVLDSNTVKWKTDTQKQLAKELKVEGKLLKHVSLGENAGQYYETTTLYFSLSHPQSGSPSDWSATLADYAYHLLYGLIPEEKPAIVINRTVENQKLGCTLRSNVTKDHPIVNSHAMTENSIRYALQLMCSSAEDSNEKPKANPNEKLIRDMKTTQEILDAFVAQLPLGSRSHAKEQLENEVWPAIIAAKNESTHSSKSLSDNEELYSLTYSETSRSTNLDFSAYLNDMGMMVY